MQPSTGPEGATSGQSTSRQGTPSSGRGQYGAPPGGSIPGRRFLPGSYRGDCLGAAPLNAALLKSHALAPKGVRGPEYQVTVLEPAGREEQLQRWGVSTSARWSEAERRPRHSDELEPNEYDADAVDGRELEELGFILDGGWTAVETARGSHGWTPGARDAGMTAHRGVLHPDEHVDAEALRAVVEDELGFTYDEVRAVYRQGRISDAQLELRARIDARLLELARAGGELMPLARAFGWAIQEAHTGGGATCRTLWRALERARKEST